MDRWTRNQCNLDIPFASIKILYISIGTCPNDTKEREEGEIRQLICGRTNINATFSNVKIKRNFPATYVATEVKPQR